MFVVFSDFTTHDLEKSINAILSRNGICENLCFKLTPLEYETFSVILKKEKFLFFKETNVSNVETYINMNHVTSIDTWTSFNEKFISFTFPSYSANYAQTIKLTFDLEYDAFLIAMIDASSAIITQEDLLKHNGTENLSKAIETT